MTSRREKACRAIATVARALAEERPPPMFVGGTVTALYALQSDVDVRPTLDVDCVVDVRTTADYYALVERLRRHGFEACTDEGAPLCRLVLEGIRVDVVGIADIAIGPTNRWYEEAYSDPEHHRLSDDLEVAVIRPVFFVATKLEAFRGRGEGDFLASHDLEDILTVLAGMPTLQTEIAKSASRVAASVRLDLIALRTNEAFIDAVPAHFEGDAAGQARADEVLAWLKALPSER